MSKGDVLEYDCRSCGEHTAGMVEGMQDCKGLYSYDLVLATCEDCGSTSVVAHVERGENETENSVQH